MAAASGNGIYSSKDISVPSIAPENKGSVWVVTIQNHHFPRPLAGMVPDPCDGLVDKLPEAVASPACRQRMIHLQRYTVPSRITKPAREHHQHSVDLLVTPVVHLRGLTYSCIVLVVLFQLCFSVMLQLL